MTKAAHTQIHTYTDCRDPGTVILQPSIQHARTHTHTRAQTASTRFWPNLSALACERPCRCVRVSVCVCGRANERTLCVAKQPFNYGRKLLKISTVQPILSVPWRCGAVVWCS